MIRILKSGVNNLISLCINKSFFDDSPSVILQLLLSPLLLLRLNRMHLLYLFLAGLTLLFVIFLAVLILAIVFLYNLSLELLYIDIEVLLEFSYFVVFTVLQLLNHLKSVPSHILLLLFTIVCSSIKSRSRIS
jgi:hypothetical protein